MMHNIQEEGHYFHTIMDFVQLLDKYGAVVLSDLRHIDLTAYEKLVTMVLRRGETEKKVAAIFKDVS